MVAVVPGRDAEVRRSSRKRWLGAAAVTLAVPAAWAAVKLADVGNDEDASIATFHGTRLGMTPADVRARFDVQGELRASTEEDGTYALELDDGAGTVRSARFEFHEGLLVAVRAELDPQDPAAARKGLFLSESTVRRTSVGANGIIELTVITRDCPTHADEVRKLLSSDSPTAPLH